MESLDIWLVVLGCLNFECKDEIKVAPPTLRLLHDRLGGCGADVCPPRRSPGTKALALQILQPFTADVVDQITHAA